MTNIMAYVKNGIPLYNEPQQELPGFEKQKSITDQYVGVVVADGLASGNGEQTGGHQKVFPVGKNFILGTGGGDFIDHVASKIQGNEGYLPPEKLGEKILRICDEDFRFSAGEQLNFIVAGPKSPDSKELQVYRLRTQRIRHPELVKGGFAIDGSGAQFVGNALTRDSQQGLSVNTQFLSIADIAITLYDHGIVATRSSGVNDELQYGFLVNGKTATLIHPRITLSQAPKEYQGEHGEIDMTKVEENKKFYQNFDGTLRKAAELERAVKNITANLIKGHPGLTPENAYEMIEERRIQLQGLERQLNNMIVDYVEHHNP